MLQDWEYLDRSFARVLYYCPSERCQTRELEYRNNIPHVVTGDIIPVVLWYYGTIPSIFYSQILVVMFGNKGHCWQSRTTSWCTVFN